MLGYYQKHGHMNVVLGLCEHIESVPKYTLTIFKTIPLWHWLLNTTYEYTLML